MGIFEDTVKSLLQTKPHPHKEKDGAASDGTRKDQSEPTKATPSRRNSKSGRQKIP